MNAMTKAADTVERIARDLSEAEHKLAELENGRADVVLKNGDVDAYHASLFKASENVKTLTAALSPAKAAMERERDRARERALEAQAKAVRVDTVAALVTEQEQALLAMEAATTALNAIAKHKWAIETHNERARQAGRDDLVIRIASAVSAAAVTLRPPTLVREPDETDEGYANRQKAAEASWAERKAHAERPREPLESEADFHRRQAEAMRGVKRRRGEAGASLGARRAVVKASVVRGGETDDAYATRKRGAELGVYRGSQETAEGFQLRVANSQSQQQRQGEIGGDPLRRAGERLIPLLQEHALGMGPKERHRKFPAPVDTRALMASDGAVLHKPHLQSQTQPLLRPAR